MLDENSREEDFDQVLEQIEKDLSMGNESNPLTNYMIIYHFAGRGVLNSGQQYFVLNEFDKEKKFYKLLPAEERIRDLAD